MYWFMYVDIQYTYIDYVVSFHPFHVKHKLNSSFEKDTCERIKKITNVLNDLCTYIHRLCGKFSCETQITFFLLFWDFCLLNCFCHICDDNALSIQTMATFMAHGIVMATWLRWEFYFRYLSHDLLKQA